MKLIELLNGFFSESEVQFMHWDVEDDDGTMALPLIYDASQTSKITDAGMEEFKNVLNCRVVDVASKDDKVSILVADVELNELEQFLYAASGLCDPVYYDKWFDERVSEEEDFSDIEEALYGQD